MRALAHLLDLALIAVAGLGLTTAILIHAVPLSGRTLVIIAGGSMDPAIPIGSLVLTEPVDASTGLLAGDVVTVRLPGRAPVTHRVVRIVDRSGATWLELKGDANADPDPVLVPGTAVVGRVAVMWPVLGQIVAGFASRSGVLLMVGLSGTLYALSLLGRRGGRARSVPDSARTLRSPA